MKRLLPLVFALFASPTLLPAELVLEPPRSEWFLQALGPPMMQQEGTGLVREQEPLQAIAAHIAQQDFDAALAYMREEYTGITELLEAGDPDNDLLSRVVVGGFMPNARLDQLSAAMLYLFGHVYMQLDMDLAAETSYLRALVPLPDYVRVHESLGLLYLRTERYDAARTHLSRAAALGLNTPNLHGALGFLNQERNNFWGAVSAYQQAMVMEPDNRQWQQGLLFALAQTYQYQSGLTLVEQMLQAEPDDPVLWMYRSQMALQAGEREAALSSLETAIRLGEENLSNLQVGATLHMELGSIERAVELLERGLAGEMNYDFIDQALAWLIRKGDWTLAEQLLAGVERNGLPDEERDRSRYLTRLASVRLNDDEQEAAREALQDAVDYDPANADALMLLADIHRDNRNYNQAELFYQRASASELHRENAYTSMAQLAIDQDDFQRALQLLQLVVERNPQRTDLQRNIDSLQNLVLLRQ